MGLVSEVTWRTVDLNAKDVRWVLFQKLHGEPSTLLLRTRGRPPPEPVRAVLRKLIASRRGLPLPRRFEILSRRGLALPGRFEILEQHTGFQDV